VCGCNTSHIVSFLFNKFKIFFSEEHLWSFGYYLFIYLFIAYILIYSSKNLKKCWKKAKFERVMFQPLALSARSHLLLTTLTNNSYELLQHAHENFKQWFCSVAALDYLSLALSIFVSSLFLQNVLLGEYSGNAHNKKNYFFMIIKFNGLFRILAYFNTYK